MYSIGVDIGGSHVTSGMFEHSNKVIRVGSLASAKINPNGSKDAIIDAWFGVISQSIALSTSSEMLGIGIAMPGPFDYFNGISLMKNVDKLDSLYGVNIREELAHRLAIPPSKIRFINDATAFSVAETRIGTASTYSKAVAITLGTGFGSSFLVDGQPVLDSDLVPKGGFLYNQDYNGKLADDIFSTRGILNYYSTMSDKTARNVEALCELLPEDQDVQKVFGWFGSALGQFLHSYLSTFGAEVLVIGGNISKAFEYFGPTLIKALPATDVYVSKFGEEAAIIGSALLLDEAYYQELLPSLKIM